MPEALISLDIESGEKLDIESGEKTEKGRVTTKMTKNNHNGHCYKNETLLTKEESQARNGLFKIRGGILLGIRDVLLQLQKNSFFLWEKNERNAASDYSLKISQKGSGLIPPSRNIEFSYKHKYNQDPYFITIYWWSGILFAELQEDITDNKTIWRGFSGDGVGYGFEERGKNFLCTERLFRFFPSDSN